MCIQHQQQAYPIYPTTTMISNEEKKTAIIQRKEEFPLNFRTTIDENQDDEPDAFLSKIKGTIEFYIVCLSYNIPTIHPKTTEEFEIAIRFFPDVLSSKQQDGINPISCLLNRWAGEYNLMTARFIPLFAKLGIENNLFEEEMRGGLIEPGRNLLKELATVCDNTKPKDDESQERVDAVLLSVLKELRRMKLFRKEDILRYDMIGEMFRQDVFPLKRFRYLVEWEPRALHGLIFPGKETREQPSKTRSMPSRVRIPIHESLSAPLSPHVDAQTDTKGSKNRSSSGRPPLTLSPGCNTTFSKMKVLMETTRNSTRQTTPSNRGTKQLKVLYEATHGFCEQE